MPRRRALSRMDRCCLRLRRVLQSAASARAGRAMIAGIVLLAGSTARAADNGTPATERSLFDFDLAALYRRSTAPAAPAAQPQALALRSSSIFAGGEGLTFTSADRSRPAWPSGHILDVLPGRR